MAAILVPKLPWLATIFLRQCVARAGNSSAHAALESLVEDILSCREHETLEQYEKRCPVYES